MSKHQPPRHSLRSPLCVLIFATGLAGVACKVTAPPPTHAPKAAALRTRPPVTPLFGERPRELELLGAGPLEVLAEGPGGPGDAIFSFIEIPAGRCAFGYAAASGGIRDLDLLAFREDGIELGADRAPDATPLLLLCVERTERVYLSARVADGRGLVALALQDVPPSARGPAEAKMRATNKSPISAQGNWSHHEIELSRHLDTLGAPFRTERRALVPLDHRIPSQLTTLVPSESCIDILVLPGEGVRGVDVEALDERRYLFARAEERGETRSLVLCGGQLDATINLKFRPHTGQGLALVLVSRLESGHTPSSLYPEVARAFTGASTSPNYEPSTRGLAGASRPGLLEKNLGVHAIEKARLETIPFESSGCTRFFFEPRAPLVGYWGEVFTESGKLLGQVEAVSAATLFTCGPSTPGRLELRALDRAGALGVHTQTERVMQGPLLQFPLAAGRLLTEAATKIPLERPSQIGSVQSHHLADDQLTRLELEVPLARCLHVFVAFEGRAFGLEGRLVERTSGLVVDLGQGRYSLSLSACHQAPTENPASAHLRLELEIRATVGHGTFLLATHQTNR